MNGILQVWKHVRGVQIQFSTEQHYLDRIMQVEPVQAAISNIVPQNFPELNVVPTFTMKTTTAGLIAFTRLLK